MTTSTTVEHENDFIGESDHILGKLIYKISEKEYLYLSETENITKYIKNWIYNRPCDELRVKKIKESIQNGSYINEPLYIAELISEEKEITYVCYDGNHRMKAFDGKKSQKIFVNLIKNVNNGDIKKRFITLNSGCPVPELYMEQTSGHLKDDIEYITDKICDNFKKCWSSSRRPRKPNFNKDNVKDILFTYLQNKVFDKYIMYGKILKLNNIYKNKFIENRDLFKHISKKQIDKAIKTDCYLFLFKNDFTEDLY
jgi:hypothetical protein